MKDAPDVKGQEQGQQEGQTVSASEVRNHDLFRKVVGEKDAALKEALSQIATYEAQAAEAAREKELKEKEAAGEYKSAMEQLKAENKAIAEKYQKQITDLKLETELTKRGANEYFTHWAKSVYDGQTDISQYVEQLAAHEKHAAQFQTSTAQPPPAPGIPAQRSSSDGAQLRADLASRDPAVRAAANQKVMEHMNRTGKLPW